MAEKGAILVTWLWQAGGSASRTQPILVPEDVKGLKVRGGSREMDLMLKGAGAAVVSMPSNELYAAMQTGAMDVGHDLLDQPDLVPPGGDRQEPDHRPRQGLTGSCSSR